MDVDALRKDATDAYNAGSMDRALEISEQLANCDVTEALYTCALILENGYSSRGKDLDAAYRYFDRLRVRWEVEEGYIGCARIIVNQGDENRMGLAREYCEELIAKKSYHFAFLILGRILEREGSVVRAKRMYLSAALRGASWGWRKLASLQWKQGQFARAIVIHSLATVAFPINALFLGGWTLRPNG